MMKFNNIIAFATIALAATCMQAQTNLPTTVIGSTEFYYYEVGDNESIYDIAAKLKVTKDDILKNNPAAVDGLEKGMKLYFPKGAVTVQNNAPQVTSNQKTIIVEEGQTLYGIAKAHGTSVDDLIALNPDAKNGVKTGQRLIVPTTDNSSNTGNTATVNADAQVRNAFERNTNNTTTTTQQITIPQGSEPIFHTLLDNENIFTLAKQYNASIEGIISANPGLEPAEYTPGAKVKVVPNSALPFTYERTGRRNYKYKVQKGESFASIAGDNGITEQELKAANPDMKKAKKGKTITVPKPYTERVTGNMATVPVDELQDYYEPRLNDLYNNLVAKRLENEVNIAMVLPFQLHKSEPPKQAYLYTDFYKGFLLAMDSAATVTNKHINLTVYDTQHNLNHTDSILALPELKMMNMIIAPSEPKQLERINKFGAANGVNVINCFTTKNEDYNENPYIYQVMTPTDEMMKDVMLWFDNKFKDYNVIYLSESSENDKEMFDQMRTHITRRNYNATTINVKGDLSYDDISDQMNPGSKYVFIPSSGQKSLVKKYIKALKEVKSERFDCDLTLIAYPEYVLYLKDYQTDLQDIDTYMFTRFFNAKGFRTRDLEAAYKANFDGEMLQGIPNMTLYGYDTGMFLLKTLCVDGRINEDTPLYRGIQTSFDFERTESWKGYTNQAIEFVHFSPDHQITVNVR